MKPVYEAENALDANLAKGILSQSGIPAVIKGEYLQGGIGDIPLAGLVTVMVNDDDELPAREVLRRWQNGELSLDAESTDHSDYHPPQYGSVPASASDEQSFSKAVAAFLIGAAIAGTAVHLWYKTPQFSYGIDTDGYGDTDRDGDGIKDARDHFRHHNVYTMTEFYAKDGKQVIKRFIYQDKGVSYAELDSNRDGTMDTFHLYNDIDEIELTFDNRAALMEEVSRRQRH